MATYQLMNKVSKGLHFCAAQSKNTPSNLLRHYSTCYKPTNSMLLRKLLQHPHKTSYTARILASPHNLAIDNRQSNEVFCRNFTEDKKTTALTLIKDLKHLKSSPIPALVLGAGGVIPFVAAPAYLIFTGGYLTSIAFSQVAYGACILSFLGGVRWGLTVSPDETVRPDWFNLGYSVTPSLVAWVGLLLPIPAAILTLMSGLLGACFMDVTLLGYPPWFKALRFLLTFCAVLSLWTTLMCRLLMGPDKTEVKEEVKVVKEKSSWFRLPWKPSQSKTVMDTPSKVTEQVPAESTIKVAPVKASPVEVTPVKETPAEVIPVQVQEPIVINKPLPVPDPPMEFENEDNKDETVKEKKELRL